VWINAEDANHWLETVVKPYRVQWEAKKREAELLAQLEEVKKATPTEKPNGIIMRRTAIPANFVSIKGGTVSYIYYEGYGHYPSKYITAKNFYMAKHPVTQNEWFEVTGITQREQMQKASNSFSYSSDEDSPICYVNWYEAIDYCNRLSLNEGLTPVYKGSRKNPTFDYNADGYRLPTEQEWEYAAKSGQKDYMRGNKMDNKAWRSEDKKTPNPLGLYYMGHFDEWCYPCLAMGYDRLYCEPFYRNSGLGFRLVRS
jgi:formylglycine-generating enzyme required for sulfatase activity